MEKVESNLKKALDIISVSNETGGALEGIKSKQFSQEISLALNLIFGEEVCASTKKYEINMEGRSYVVSLDKNNFDSGHDISIVENFPGMSLRKLSYGFDGDELCDLSVGLKEIHILNKFAVCEVVKECANEEQIRKYEKSIRGIIDQVDGTFTFMNGPNKKGSINKNFMKHPGIILVKLGDGNAYSFPTSINEKAYKRITNYDLNSEDYNNCYYTREPLKLDTCKKIFDVLKVAVENNKSK